MEQASADQSEIAYRLDRSNASGKTFLLIGRIAGAARFAKSSLQATNTFREACNQDRVVRSRWMRKAKVALESQRKASFFCYAAWHCGENFANSSLQPAVAKKGLDDTKLARNAPARAKRMAR
jgi:hypothetical protein